MSAGRVVVTIPHLAPWGTEAQTIQLVRALAGGGWAVTVCCFYGHEPGTVAALEEAGAAPVLFGMRREQGLGRLLARVRREVARVRPDVLHVQYLTPGLPPVLAGRLERVRTVFATVHHSGSGHGLRERLLLRAAARLSTACFCVSRAVEESWFGSSALFDPAAAGPPPRHATVYNAVREAQGTPGQLERLGGEACAALGLSGKRVVGAVGRLTREKGHETLLRALPAVLEAAPDAVLLVVGSGPEEGALRQLAVELGVAGNVVWAGWRPPRELPGIYAALAVAVVPSISEGFGLAAAEASAHGRPVVASCAGGLREVVEDGVSGILAAPGDAGALAAAISRLLGDPALARRLGEGGRSRVAGLFSVERFAGCTLAAYRAAG